MSKQFFWMIVAMLVVVLEASATIRYVSSTGAGTHTTIEAAALAAASGDTILIGPGNFTLTGSINETSKRLTYIGAGWDQTFVNTSSYVWYANTTGQTGTSWEGLSVTSSGQVFVIANSADSIAFRRCIISTTATNARIFAVGSNNGRSVTIEDCILYSSANGTGNPIVDITNANFPTTIRNTVFVNQGGSNNCRAIGGYSTSGTVELYNCVFLNFQTPLALSAAGGPVIAVNNMFYDWIGTPGFGTYNIGSSVWDYNASTASPAAPGTNALTITTDPFVNYDETNNFQYGITDLNLHPTNGAAFIDSGHPSLIDFLDSTTSDRGVYGGPKPLVDNGVPNYPWAVNIVTSPNLVGVGTPVNATAIGRVGPQY